MKPTSGNYYVGLDHIRALAAFMVFTWHFVHMRNGQLSWPPPVPFSFLTEGHTGVALFMVLSGYLFAKILDGKSLLYGPFLWNRLIRLGPLLLVVLVICGVQAVLAKEETLLSYLGIVGSGFVLPVWPNGGWSIVCEFHFYLLLPLLLWLGKRTRLGLPAVLLGAIALRIVWRLTTGEVQSVAYPTIIGRIDQFVLGILAFQYRRYFTGRHLLCLAIIAGFGAFFWYFDYQGGYYTGPSYPSPRWIWVYFCTIEGIGYATLIVWYDTSFQHSQGRLSRFVAAIGACSYSFYLLHFFFVEIVARFINRHVIRLVTVDHTIALAPLGFLMILPVAYLSYRLIEMPFLRFRKPYRVDDAP